MTTATLIEWDDWDASVEDDEVTRDTEHAFRLATRSVEAEVTAWRFAEGGAALRVYANGYVTEFRGQSSATAHGKHGSDPRRIAALRRLAVGGNPVPVRIVFIEPGGNVWYAVWLDRGEPEVVNIANDTARRRQGWRCKDMIRGEGLVVFPESDEVPPRTEGGLF